MSTDERGILFHFVRTERIGGDFPGGLLGHRRTGVAAFNRSRATRHESNVFEIAVFALCGQPS